MSPPGRGRGVGWGHRAGGRRAQRGDCAAVLAGRARRTTHCAPCTHSVRSVRFVQTMRGESEGGSALRAPPAPLRSSPPTRRPHPTPHPLPAGSGGSEVQGRGAGCRSSSAFLDPPPGGRKAAFCCVICNHLLARHLLFLVLQWSRFGQAPPGGGGVVPASPIFPASSLFGQPTPPPGIVKKCPDAPPFEQFLASKRPGLRLVG